MRMTRHPRRMAQAAVTCLAVVSMGSIGCTQERTASLRVLSYNIHHGRGMDGQVDLPRIAEVIKSTNPDLVALQEVDRGVERTDRVDQPARLAELTGMQVIFERNIHYQGGEYGNAVLSRLPVDYHRNHYLPPSRPNEQRGMLEVGVQAAGHKLIFFATHFDYRPDDGERMASVDMFRELAAARGRESFTPAGATSTSQVDPPSREGPLDPSSPPIILAGDINDVPQSRVLDRLREFMFDSFMGAGAAGGLTFPADEPIKRIDYILYNGHPALRCVEHRVIPEAVASDHRPVLAVFMLRR